MRNPGIGWLVLGVTMAVLGFAMCLTLVGIVFGLPLGALSVLPLRRWRLARERAAV